MTATWQSPVFGGTGLTLADLEAMPRHQREAVLAGTISVLRGAITEMKQQLMEAESYMREAMLQRGATLADAGEWQVHLAVRRNYSFNVETLSKLQAFVEPEQYDAAVHMYQGVKIDKRQLNSLSKRGGEIAEIIGQATTEDAAGYEVEVTRRGR